MVADPAAADLPLSRLDDLDMKFLGFETVDTNVIRGNAFLREATIGLARKEKSPAAGGGFVRVIAAARSG
jgi:hypothetical protein